MNRISRFAVAAGLVAATVTVAPSPAAAVPPAGACSNPDPAVPAVTAQPWAQRVLDPTSVWPYSTGVGVTVAVVDSGVDADHPQLRGKVLTGKDFFFVGDYPGNFDCVSHGTAVASIIAARRVHGIGFAGLAPGATVLPVRVTDRDSSEDGTLESINPTILARGIRYAADSGAKVLNLSLAGAADHPEVREAVAYARHRDVLLVASVGNSQQQTGGERETYPAGYPGVLGVGGVNQNEQLMPGSQTGPQVDVVAPGDGVVGANRVAGHQYWQGTSFAAPFVSATAALVRARYPKLSADAVARRIMATATPAPGGSQTHAYGAGIVNPYRAVTDQLDGQAPAAMPVVHKQFVDAEKVRAAAWWADAGSGARIGALAAGGVALLGLVLALIVTYGRRTRWAAKRAAPLPNDRAIDEPPDQVFLLPPPSSER